MFSFQVVFFPECCDYVGSSREETLKLSEPLTGETVGEYRKLAKDSNVWLSLGGVHEAIPDDASKIYNTHLLVDNQGQIVAKYSKLHMFNVITPEFKFRESEMVRSGGELVPPVDSPIGKIGLQIVSSFCQAVNSVNSSVLLYFAVLRRPLLRSEHVAAQAGRGSPHVPVGVRRFYGEGPLGGATASPGYREPMLCDSGGPDWVPQQEAGELRARNGRRSLGQDTG